MDLTGFALLTSLAISLIAYFIPPLRNGKRVFSPIPGVIAIRLGINGTARQSDDLKTRFLLNASLVLFAIALVVGYYILISTLVPYPSARQEGVALVPLLPGITISFSRLLSISWIIGLSVVVHEYMHYWSSIRQGISVRSAGVGWAFFFPIAFVEPNEEELLKSSLKKRVRIYAAGPAANMAIAIVTYFLILTLLKPGIYVIDVVKGSPAWKCGLMKGDVILSINGEEVKSLYKLKQLISNNEVLKLKVLRNGKVVEVVAKPSKGKLGVVVLPFVPSWPLSALPLGVMQAAIDSLFWLNGVNLGLAIINALPLFISDGGRILSEMALEARKFEKTVLLVQAATLIMILEVMLRSIKSLG